ncbi:MAG: TerB family tellurite resistance protein [Bacteroidetes bacterium]|nr:TerB family tellurite resistance protein [Bacteroidota bacterium]
MIETQLKVLLELARIDNVFDQRERNMIYSVGLAHGMKRKQIDRIIKNGEGLAPEALEDLTDEEKFEMLYNIVQLMKIDGRIFNSEILFCQEIAEKLGYKRAVIIELNTMIFTNPDIQIDRRIIKDQLKRFASR